MAERRFTEKETALILKKAALIQAKAAQEQNAPISGYSQAELESAAGDAGLNPELLQRAISELGLDGAPASDGQRGPLRAFLGAPWSYCEEIPLPSLPSREELENLLLRMNEICKAVGTGAIGPIGLSWDMNYMQTANTGIRRSVRIHSKPEGAASIVVASDMKSMGGGIFGGMGGGIGLGVGLGVGIPLILTSAVPGLVGAFAVAGPMAGAYLVSRLTFSLYSRHCGKETRRIAEEIRSLLEKTERR